MKAIFDNPFADIIQRIYASDKQVSEGITPPKERNSPKTEMENLKFSRLLDSAKPAPIPVDPPHNKPSMALPEPSKMRLSVDRDESLTVNIPTIVSAKRFRSTRVYIDTYNKTSSTKRSDMIGVIIEESRNAKVDPSLSVAIAKVESNLNPNAVSRDGHASKGLFQLLDTTGKEHHARLRLEENYNPFDPNINAHLGAQHLRRLLDIFSKKTRLTESLFTQPVGDIAELEKFAIAAFNAGEGTVANAQARAAREGKNPSIYANIEPYLPSITKRYVKNVLDTRTLLSAFSDFSTNKVEDL